MHRRAFLSGVVGTVAVAGCLQGSAGTDEQATETGPAATTPAPTAPTRSTTTEPATATAISEGNGTVEWTRTTNCEHTPSGMYDSVIRVQRTTTTIGDGHTPVVFSELPPGEKAIARSVIEEGGVAACEPSADFEALVERISDHQQRQESMTMYLKRGGTYYALYVEVLDQVLSY
ncbi:hypothetical protein [Halococcus sp. AFM35]|uniref:hypothetical protein n=1 Tax=Halococcus sp. AFM35 TaxID=3421653 RepID=UPI003EBCEF36